MAGRMAKLMMRAAALGLIGLAMAACSSAQAPSARPAATTPDAFTAKVADMVRQASPGTSVDVRGPLTLGLDRGKPIEVQVNLDRVWALCARQSPSCDSELQTFVRGISERAVALAQPIERASLVLAVRPAGYARDLDKATGGELLVRPVSGDLVAMVVADFPTSMRPLSKRDLASLSLTADEAFDAATTNLVSRLRPAGEVLKALPPNALGVAQGDDYESSRFALHAQWADIAAAMGGQLAVMVPDTRRVLYGDLRQATTLDALRTLATKVASNAGRPISGTIFRWTKAGWEVLGSQGAAASGAPGAVDRGAGERAQASSAPQTLADASRTTETASAMP